MAWPYRPWPGLADVAVEPEVVGMFAEIGAEPVPLYGVVSNAGITARLGKFLAADPIVWLLSGAASYMTGTTVRCAGGL